MGNIVQDSVKVDRLMFTPKLGDDLLWRNSANVLCNYMKKQDFLDTVLINSAIIPRYVEESLEYLNLDNVSKICFPMTCFCDIPFSKVATHMSHYGEYGIGLDKKAVLKKYRIQPIHYMNSDSPLADDFKEAFQTSVQEKFSGAAGILANYIISTLIYMKPIWGLEKDKNGDLIEYVYQDECEWRYIPSDHFPETLHLIMKQGEMTERGKEIYNNALSHHKECWLKFDWSEVRYLMVPDESSVKHTIQVIRSLDGIDDMQKDLLISKIEISRRFSENM